MEGSVSTFGSKASVHIFTAIDLNYVPTEFKNIISYYTPITQTMVDSHYEIMRGNNSGAGLGRQPSAGYGAAADDAEK